MKIKIIAAILTARITSFFLRLTGSGGTSLPGKAAMFICSNLLEILSKEVRTVVITGTNGKTTTSRILSEILKTSGLSFFENKSGANLISGITASFAANSTLCGKPKYKFAVIECDEAAFKTVSPIIQPETIVVTNLFRDQLDRYGEITHTKNNIVNGIKKSPDSTLILNADDSLSYSIASAVPNKAILFGLDEPPYGEDGDFLSDAPYCIKCKSAYSYKFRTYGHLGSFYCENCGYHRVQPDISVTDIKLNSDSSLVNLHINNVSFKASIALPGAYNIYNALSATAAAYSLGISNDFVINALSTFKSGFGRMEKLILDGVDVNLILVKNPAGLNQVINFLKADSNYKRIVLILNDNFADGTDISWIWDVNFEKFNSFKESIASLIVTGERAEELNLRFKYSGYPESEIILEKDFNRVISRIINDNADKLPVYVLPTYTAMFEFRKALSKKYKIRKFWK